MQRTLKEIEFANSRDRLIIKTKALNVLRRYGRKKDTYESGGILLGYVYKDHTEVVNVTTPSRFDSFGPRFFIRSRISAQAQIDKAWKKSNGTLIYLGEWHTHSEANPKPSVVDREMIMKSRRETKMEIDFLYLMIVGHNCSYWVGKQITKRLSELKRVN